MLAVLPGAAASPDPSWMRMERPVHRSTAMMIAAALATNPVIHPTSQRVCSANRFSMSARSDATTASNRSWLTYPSVTVMAAGSILWLTLPPYHRIQCSGSLREYNSFFTNTIYDHHGRNSKQCGWSGPAYAGVRETWRVRATGRRPRRPVGAWPPLVYGTRRTRRR